MSLSRLLLRLVLGGRPPIVSGELRVRGPSAPVTIRRDRYGVPHVDAESEADASFALGFCQAQDRGGQLEVLWRVARGRLAEWVGSGGLGADRMSRRIGFRRAAEKQWPALVGGARTQIAAFADGVSAGFATGLTRKPHEFAILGGEPSPWDAADVLAVLKLQSFSLASNWDVELARLRILLGDGPEAVLALDPTGGSEGGIGTGGEINPPPGALDRLSADLAALQRYLPAGGGSNNWVIAGSRTASGKPLLASDPHLGPSSPPPWYLAHVRCPEWEAAGASLAGAPGFPIGHNGFAAWGVTAGLSDNSDVFIETLGDDGDSVREPGGTFAACERVREVIRVKGQSDEALEVLVTPRGPLISPLVTGVPVALSLRAVWLDPLPVNGFLGAVRARSFDEFRRCFDHWPQLPLNVLYADANGTTGWQLVGQVPRRSGGNGLLPRVADQPDSGWAGLVPFEQMPWAADPAAGYFATANNDPAAGIGGTGEGRGSQNLSAVSAGAPETVGNSSLAPHPSPLVPFLGADYCDPYRVRAINAALSARGGWTAADCLGLQRDVRCIAWEEMRDAVLSLAPADRDARLALGMLRGWDGRVDSESAAACVFELFVAEMSVRVAKAKAPNSWRAVLGETWLGDSGQNLFAHRRVGHLVRVLREQPAGWFASWPAELESALGHVTRTLRREAGPGPRFWSWGHLRRLRLDHPLFKDHGWLGPVFNLGPFPCGGDSTTICQASVRPAAPTAFTHNIPNLRAVFDLADLSKSRFVLCGGQSGNPWSAHFADQVPLWRSGESIAVPWLQAEVIRSARDTLRLLPGG